MNSLLSDKFWSQMREGVIQRLSWKVVRNLRKVGVLRNFQGIKETEKKYIKNSKSKKLLSPRISWLSKTNTKQGTSPSIKNPENMFVFLAFFPFFTISPPPSSPSPFSSHRIVQLPLNLLSQKDLVVNALYNN